MAAEGTVGAVSEEHRAEEGAEGAAAAAPDDHREASRQQWEQAAEGWAAEAEERERGPAGRAADWMLERAAPQRGEHVIELASGAGDVGLRAAEAVGAEGRVLITDFAEPMVEIVRRRSEGIPQVEARALDAEDPGLDERFDVALCRLGFMLMPDAARALRATRGLLVPGGRLALAVWAAADRNPWLSLVFDAVMGVLGAPPPAPGTPGPFALADPRQLRALLEEAGFDRIEIDEAGMTRSYPSPVEWWATMYGSDAGPISRLLRSLPQEQRDQVRDRAIASASAFAADGEVRLPATLIVARCSVTSAGTTRR
jgi:SAM-dependent methyltransferase